MSDFLNLFGKSSRQHVLVDASVLQRVDEELFDIITSDCLLETINRVSAWFEMPVRLARFSPLLKVKEIFLVHVSGISVSHLLQGLGIQTNWVTAEVPLNFHNRSLVMSGMFMHRFVSEGVMLGWCVEIFRVLLRIVKIAG